MALAAPPPCVPVCLPPLVAQAVRKVDLDQQQQAAAAGTKRRNPMDDLKKEIKIMRCMHHPNIVSLNEVIGRQASGGGGPLDPRS